MCCSRECLQRIKLTLNGKIIIRFSLLFVRRFVCVKLVTKFLLKRQTKLILSKCGSRDLAAKI